MDATEVKVKNVYHIDDMYFNASRMHLGLESNKENGNCRPTYLSIQDKDDEFFWAVPLSTQFDKFKKIYDDKILRYGKNYNGIVLGQYAGKKCAFLIQNIFPVTCAYIHHSHTISGNDVPMIPTIGKEVDKCCRDILNLHSKGYCVSLTNIGMLKHLLLDDIQLQIS